MKDIICNDNKNNIIIYNTLRKLGLRPNHTGTIFILRAVQLVERSSDIIVMKDIYSKLSQKYPSFNSSQIRVAIKYALDNRNENKSINNFNEIFGYDYDEEIFTNKDFIEELARII